MRWNEDYDYLRDPARRYFGYSHFFAGEFIEETGPSGDIDFFYAAAQFTF